MWKMSTRNALKANWNFINCKIIAFDWCITMLVKSWEWNRPVPVSATRSRPSQTCSETKLFRTAFARDDQFGNGVKQKWIILSRWICLSALEWCVFLTLVFCDESKTVFTNSSRKEKHHNGLISKTSSDIFYFLLQLISDIVRFCCPWINMKLD